MKRIAVIGFALMLSACATGQGEIPPGPEAWRSGYKDGCDSGFVSAGHPYYRYSKDQYRAASDQQYSMGWQDGFNTCKGKYDATTRMLR